MKEILNNQMKSGFVLLPVGLIIGLICLFNWNMFEKFASFMIMPTFFGVIVLFVGVMKQAILNLDGAGQ